jgi:hypothetical protein
VKRLSGSRGRLWGLIGKERKEGNAGCSEDEIYGVEGDVPTTMQTKYARKFHSIFAVILDWTASVFVHSES